MERLTKRTTNCPLPVLVRDRAFGPAYFVSEEDYTDYRDALEKLARYEDTGLEPEEIKRSDALLRGFIDLGRRHARTLSLIEKVMIADREGRLLVLPCKVGDTVYYHFQFKNKRVLPFTRKAKVKKICCNRKTLEVDVELMDAKESGIMKTFHAEDFGKSVFLTREDAEKALEGTDE